MMKYCKENLAPGSARFNKTKHELYTYICTASCSASQSKSYKFLLEPLEPINSHRPSYPDKPQATGLELQAGPDKSTQLTPDRSNPVQLPRVRRRLKLKGINRNQWLDP